MEDRLNEILSNWNLSDSDLLQKSEVLKSWGNLGFSVQEYSMLLNIASFFEYYDITKSLNKMTDFFRRNFPTVTMNNTQFIPYKTKENRQQSSEKLVDSFTIDKDLPSELKDSFTFDFFLKKYWADDTKYNEEKNFFFIDDFIGTGQSVSAAYTGSILVEGSEKERKDVIKRILKNNINIYFWIICSHDTALNKIQKELDYLNEEFEKESGKSTIGKITIFSIDKAQDIFERSGGVSREMYDKLSSKMKTVFEIKCNHFTTNTTFGGFTTIPNNNVPFLINSSKNWQPLFERRGKEPINNLFFRKETNLLEKAVYLSKKKEENNE